MSALLSAISAVPSDVSLLGTQSATASPEIKARKVEEEGVEFPSKTPYYDFFKGEQTLVIQPIAPLNSQDELNVHRPDLELAPQTDQAGKITLTAVAKMAPLPHPSSPIVGKMASLHIRLVDSQCDRYNRLGQKVDL